MSSSHVVEMKSGWDQRAKENAKWYINTLSQDQTDEAFDESGRFEVQQQIVNSLPILTGGRNPKDLRLLEIGCGIGRMSKHLAGIFGEVVGVDVSAEMIAQATERLKHIPNASFYETSGVDFPLFPDASFDVIFSAYVFQHIPSAEIIESNIVDAFRVLKPGGVFKFSTNCQADEASVQSPKDSWRGDIFSEQRIRQLALQLNAQLIGLTGGDTHYCWTLLRRRQSSVSPDGAKMPTAPQIVLCGHADDLASQEVANAGERPYVTLVLTGVLNEWCDANSLAVQIGELRCPPGYVGPLGANVTEFLSNQNFSTVHPLTQINVTIPAELPKGSVPVAVHFPDANSSNVCTITLI